MYGAQPHQLLGNGLASLLNETKLPLKLAPYFLLEFCLDNYLQAGFDFEDFQADVATCLQNLTQEEDAADSNE
jgi:hypothetical protein